MRFAATSAIFPLAFACAFACAPAFAAEPLDVAAFRQDTAHNPFSFLELLHADADHPLESASLEESVPASPRSHVRILYSSEVPVPVRVTFPEARAADHHLVAILPADADGDASIDLTVSPAWYPMVPITIDVYWAGDSTVMIRDVKTENRLSPIGRWMAYLRQPFMPEYFSSFSLGTIYGYSIAGVPFTLVAGVLAMLVIVGIRAYRKTLPLVAIAATVWGVALLLYGVRFAADIAGATVADQRQWWGEGQYNDMRYLYAEADALHGESARFGGSMKVSMCTGLTTPMKYFLHPIEVGDIETWDTATHGVLHSVWDDRQTSFSCGGMDRDGEVVRRFPDGEAVVRFTDNP